MPSLPAVVLFLPRQNSDTMSVRCGMLVSANEKYFPQSFRDEQEIESVVKNYAEYLFGSYILMLPKSKISTTDGAGTIPDAIVVDIEHDTWYLVEAELERHGTWQHIAPQISKQIVAIIAPLTIEALLKTCIDMAKNDKKVLALFDELGIPQIQIHGKLKKIFESPPVIAIPIDGVPSDLQAWAKSLKYEVRIWRITKYQSLDGTRVLYEIPDEYKPADNTEDNGSSQAPNQLYDFLLQSGLVHAGQKVFLEYGPRGKTKQRWEGILRESGIEIEGIVRAPSTAAVYCIQKAGSPRRTANGWTMWKTEEGLTLDEVYQKAKELQEKNSADTAS